MAAQPLRWGILGTAHIARKNWKAIRNCDTATLVAVASRSLERSRQFIAECQTSALFELAPRALGSYEELLAAPDIEAVYIPLPTGLRKEWVLRAAAAGKHVLGEKPCAVSVNDLQEMIEACRHHDVQFMDGVMFMHSARLEGIRQMLDDGSSVGPLKRITSAFSFSAPPEFFQGNIRAQSALEPHGCLGDLGWYCIRFSLFAMTWQLPRTVTGRMISGITPLDGGAPVPTEFSGELFFESGISAGFYCSFLTAHQQWARIAGTAGCLEIEDFVVPFFGCEARFQIVQSGLKIHGCDFNVEAHPQTVAVAEHSNSHPSAQETNMFRNFSRQVRSGNREELWPEVALKTQQVMEACYKSSRAEGSRVNL